MMVERKPKFLKFSILCIFIMAFCVGCMGDDVKKEAQKTPEAAPQAISTVVERKLPVEAVLGTYTVEYKNAKKTSSQPMDFVLLDKKLTYVPTSQKSLREENSFQSYDAQTGVAKLQRTNKGQQGNDTVEETIEIKFIAKDKEMLLEGVYIKKQNDKVVENYTLLGTREWKLGEKP